MTTPGILNRVRAALHEPQEGDPPPPSDDELRERARVAIERLVALAPDDVRPLPLFGLVVAAGPAVLVPTWRRMLPRGLTMCGPETVTHLVGVLETIHRDGVPGDLLEAGVWRGGLPLVMRAFLDEVGDTERRVWLADTFDGLPGDPERPEDRLAHALLVDIGSLRAGRADVEAAFARFGLLDERVRFLQGRFRDTLAAAPIERLALLRLDADYFEGTRDALEALYARVSPGGFVVVDDYHLPTGCRAAVDAFRAREGSVEPLVPINSQAVLWRRAA